jgi:hypothetical protein
MLPTRIVLAIGLVLAVAASSRAQSFSSTKVVETGVNYPGVGTFTQMNVRPSISGNTIAFGGTLATGPLLATVTSGTITPIASNSTPVPGGTGNFTMFNSSPIGLSGSVYAFLGNGNPGPTNAGVYSNVTGSLAPVINNGTAYPTGGTFTTFSAPAVSGSTVVFSGSNIPGGPPIGVFTRTGSGPIVTVANTSTAIPGGGGNFADFTHPSGSPYGPGAPPFLSNISGPNVVFGGRNATNTTFGLFLATQFGIGAVATNATSIPNGTGNFTAISPIPAISGTNVAFQAFGSGSQQGVYRSVNSVLSRVADRTTAVPGAAGTFDSFLFTDVAISGDRVAFRGHGTSGTDGIYTDLTGSLTKVIAIGDTFDGKTVSAVDIGQFALDGSSLAVMVTFTNGSAGIYTITPVPEPAGLLAIGVAGLLATRIRKRR